MLAVRHCYPHIHSFRFADADFFGNKLGFERAAEFATLIIQNNIHIDFFIETRITSINAIPQKTLKLLKQAGLKSVYLGIESGCNHILKQMSKQITLEEIFLAVERLNKNNIDFGFGFMMFTPWTQKEDIYSNLNFLKTINGVQFDKLYHSMNIVPNTPAAKLPQVDTTQRDMYNYFVYDISESFVSDLQKIGQLLFKNHSVFFENYYTKYKTIKARTQHDKKLFSQIEQDINQWTCDFFESSLELLPIEDTNS